MSSLNNQSITIVALGDGRRASNGMMTKTRTSIFIWILFVALCAVFPVRALAAQQCFTTTVNGVPQEVCAEVPTGPTPTAPVFSSNVDDNVIASCRNVNGALSSSVGVTAVTGGAFVPVNDAAVTLNTGILVYKECVLRNLVNKARQDETAKILSGTMNSFVTGRCVKFNDRNICDEYAPYFSENLPKEQAKLADTVVTRNVEGTALNQINPAFQDTVKTAVVRTYAQQTRNPGASLACSYQGTPAGLAAIHRGGFTGPQDLFTIADPNCNPLWSFFNAQNMVMSDVAAEQQNMLTQLGWGRGVYSQMSAPDANGETRVVTPGFILANDIEQKLGSGFRQLESANDIGQMIDGYFTNIGRQLYATGVGGLRGLITASFGQLSYLDQVVANTSAAVQSSTASAAMQNLAAAVQNETAYLAAKNATANVIMQKAAELRARESQCWSQFVIPAVTAYAQQNGIASLKIATTTTASQAVIDKNFTALASSTVTEINASNTIVNKINQIIAGVNSTNSADAYTQLNALVASGILHNSYQVQGAQQQMKDVQGALTGIVTDTITAWGDNQDPTVGWCNINNQAVVANWANKWKK